MSKPCPQCGKPMNRQSKICRSCYLENKAKPENWIKKTCPVCLKEFTVHISEINRGQGIYCSIPCARSGSPTRKRIRETVTCKNCGREIERHSCSVKKNITNSFFCNKECWNQYNQGENHHGWKGGQNDRVNPDYTKWRKAVLERDKYYCRLCHARRKLEVHHIYRFTTHPDIRWDVDNGITLCHECHVKIRNHEEECVDIFNVIKDVRLVVWNV